MPTSLLKKLKNLSKKLLILPSLTKSTSNQLQSSSEVIYRKNLALPFENQLREVCRKYTDLHIDSDNDCKYLQGCIPVEIAPNTVHHFFVRITWADNFPYAFPRLFELGGFITRHADYHITDDGECCITSPLDELIITENQISIINFIKKHAIPFLAHQVYRKEKGRYIHEYKHAHDGLWQSIQQKIPAPDTNFLLYMIQCAVGKATITCRKKEKCPCGSGKRFKRCHLYYLELLTKLPPKQLQKVLNNLSSNEK